MKRKLALLLAFTMVLSLVPVNVFANTALIPVGRSGDVPTIQRMSGLMVGRTEVVQRIIAAENWRALNPLPAPYPAWVSDTDLPIPAFYGELAGATAGLHSISGPRNGSPHVRNLLFSTQHFSMGLPGDLPTFSASLVHLNSDHTWLGAGNSARPGFVPAGISLVDEGEIPWLQRSGDGRIILDPPAIFNSAATPPALVTPVALDVPFGYVPIQPLNLGPSVDVINFLNRIQDEIPLVGGLVDIEPFLLAVARGEHLIGDQPSGTFIEVALVRRPGNDNQQAWLVTVAHVAAGGQIANAQIPIEYVAYDNDDNVNLQVHPWGFGAFEAQNIALATRQTGRFIFSMDGDPRVFYDYVDIGRIDISEVFRGAFGPVTVDHRTFDGDGTYGAGPLNNIWYGHWNVTMTLPPGFAWAPQSDNVTLDTRWGQGLGFDLWLPASQTADGQPATNRMFPAWPPLGLTGATPDWETPIALGSAQVDGRTQPRHVQRTSIGNQHNRTISICFELANTGRAGAPDRLELEGLRIVSESGARTGDVQVDISVGRFVRGAGAAGTPTHPILGGGGTLGVGTQATHVVVDYDTIVVANHRQEGISLRIHENDDLETFRLESGRREFYWYSTANWDVIDPSSVSANYHQTARVVLREYTPRVLNLVGGRRGELVFTFPDGIQILGARVNTNNAAFGGGSSGHRVDDAIWWHSHTNTVLWESTGTTTGGHRDGYDRRFDAEIRGNQLIISPERRTDRDHDRAEMTVQFYVSVQAGFEHLYGDELEIVLSGSALGNLPEEDEVVALIWDPIVVDPAFTNIPDEAGRAWGLTLTAPLNNITIHETEPGALRLGTELWIGAEHVALRASTAQGFGGLTVSNPIVSGAGVVVRVTGMSNDEGAHIVLSGVQVQGSVVPNFTYSIIVGGNAVAHNAGQAPGMRWGYEFGADTLGGVNHGIFTEPPYLAPAFSFVGDDIFAGGTVTPPPVDPGQQQPGQQQPPTTGPVTLGEWMTSFNSLQDPGYVFHGRPLVLVPNIENPAFHTSYVMVRIVQDVLGVHFRWDAATYTATFYNDAGETVSFTNGSQTAVVNGVPTQIMAGTLRADARIIQDMGQNRMFVPVAFFQLPGLPFAANVQWVDGEPGFRSVIVTPR